MAQPYNRNQLVATAASFIANQAGQAIQEQGQEILKRARKRARTQIGEAFQAGINRISDWWNQRNEYKTWPSTRKFIRPYSNTYSRNMRPSRKYKRTTRRYSARRPFRTGIPTGRCVELKYHDYSLNNHAVLSAGTNPIPAIESLVLIPEGNGGEQRSGRKVFIKSIQLTITVKSVSFTASSPNFRDQIKVILVQDTQCNKATINWNDLMVGGTSGYINLNNRERFRVLKSWLMPYPPCPQWNGTNITSLGQQKILTYYSKVNIPVIIDAEIPSIGNVFSNNIILMAAADTASRFEMDVRARLRFVD